MDHSELTNIHRGLPNQSLNVIWTIDISQLFIKTYTLLVLRCILQELGILLGVVSDCEEFNGSSQEMMGVSLKFENYKF